VLPRFVEIESKYGSLSKGMLAERGAASTPAQPIFRTLKDGLGSLIGALARSIESKVKIVRGEVETIERQSSGYRLRVSGLDRDVPTGPRVRIARIGAAGDLIRVGGLGQHPANSSTVISMDFQPQIFKPLLGSAFRFHGVSGSAWVYVFMAPSPIPRSGTQNSAAFSRRPTG
jgi:hypothetical protein